ncbi:MAG TPA: glucose-6-phosphate dehydrogenase assembly protein OpcA [Chthoniobacterales bacterium]|nr:glucose-6-phosphate dehydrogenase assembly protein OpcA [Chthoniobacterales bacterium]
MSAETFTAGLPVEVSQIHRELKKLWEASGGVMTRASLINLAVYSQAPDSLGKNTALISQITENHACRAIVIAADPSAKESGVESWISAHCHVSRAGSKQICSEQLSFFLKGKQCGLLPNIVFAQLDSDLPLYLWWQENFQAPIDPQLWAWVDRVIYDSQTWANFDEQMSLVERAQKEARQRIVLCDLNWVRLVHLRIALAQFFDHPVTHHHLAEIKSLEIAHAPGFRSTALLLVGWLAGQLDWEAKEENRSSLGFVHRTDEGESEIAISLEEAEGEPISSCRLRTASAEFRVVHKPGADLLDVSFGRTAGRHMDQVLPAGGNNIVELVKEELMRGGPHRVYLRAVERVRRIL